MISIIIPLFNQAKNFGKCLNSIFSQTYKDFELIVVDDGSSDNSLEIAKNFVLIAERNKIKYKILIHHKNQGAPAARNTGHRTAEGDYLLFCDSDAVLKPDFLEIHLKILKNKNDACYSYSSFYWGRKYFASGEFSADRLKKEPYIHTMALIKKSCFPTSGWDEEIKKFQDWDLWLVMLEEGKCGIWINDPLFMIHPGGVISSWLPSFAYKYLPFLSQVKKYNQAKEIIKNKHKLS